MATSPQDILALPVVTLRDWLASGALRATELADALIAHIAEVEPHVGAFAWYDPGFLRAQAEQADRHRQSGRPIGPLHGLPIGLKDVIDTKGIPTENGTVLDGGRMPAADATVVARLRAAGGEIGDAQGIADEDLRRAVQHGVAKVNVDTDLRLAMTVGIREALQKNPKEFDPRKILGPARDLMGEVVELKMRVLGSVGKA